MDFERDYKLFLQIKKNFTVSAHQTPPAVVRPTAAEQSIPVYTVLTILKKMKEELGLEAMLEYMQTYVSTIERYNPELKMAVTKAVSMMSMGRVYENACREKKSLF